MSKIRRALLTLVLMAVSAPGIEATYTTPTVITAPQALSDGRLYMEVVFTGNAGEKLPQAFYGTSKADLMVQVYAFMAKLNSSKSDSADTKLQVGQVVPSPNAVVATPPTLTPFQQYIADLNILFGLQQAIALGGGFDANDANYQAFVKKVQQEFSSTFLSNPDAAWSFVQ